MKTKLFTQLTLVLTIGYSLLAINCKAQGCFNAAVNYAAGTSPYQVCTADFNNDGFADLATADYNGNNVSILLGTGTGTFTAAGTFTVGGTNPISVCSGDFNSDGFIDLAVLNYTSGNISKLFGDGTGNFTTTTTFGAFGQPYQIISADFNGDNKPDLATVSNSTNHVSVNLNNGSGTFLAAVSYTVGTNPRALTSADFNGDTFLDLAVANYGSNSVSVLLGGGAGTFGAPVNLALGGSTGPEGVTSGDFNGDGQPDIATANYTSNNISVILRGSGIWKPAQTFTLAAGTNPQSIISADFNFDGYKDLATANYIGYNASLLTGNGAGSFGAAINYAVGNNPQSVVAADFNGDTKLDLAVSNYGSNNVSILLNNLPKTSISGVTTICPGSTTTLTASGANSGTGSYAWSPNNDNTNTAVLSPTGTTVYSVTGTNLGCSTTSTATVTVTVNPLPNITINGGVNPPYTAICIGNTATLTAGGATTYTWTSSLNITIAVTASITVSPTTTTYYAVQGTDVNGCVNNNGITVNVNALPTVTISTTPAGGSVCLGSSITLTGGGIPTGTGTYTWSANAGSATTTTVSISPAATAPYGVTGTDGNGCVGSTAMNIVVNPLPTILINGTNGGVSPVCIGSSIVLTASGGGSPNAYTWNTAATTSTISVSPTFFTTYNVTGYDVNTCTNTAFFHVTVNPLPTVSATNATVCAGSTATLTASGAITYTWSPNNTTGATTTPSPTVTTSYTVTGTDVNTCTNTAIGTVTEPTNPAPEICMVTADSFFVNNIVYWERSLYPTADSFIVYRYSVSSGTYLKIGTVSKDSSQLTDIKRGIGGPNGGDPNITSWRYKLAVKDNCGSISAQSPYHETVNFQMNSSNLSWNVYAIQSPQSNPTTGYQVMRDSLGIGDWRVFVSTLGTSTTDPAYTSFPNSNYRVDALGFSCNPTLRLSGNNSIEAAKVRSHSNINNNRHTSSINQLRMQNAECTIYPNPANTIINVELKMKGENTNLVITDMLGNTVKQSIIYNLTSLINVADLSEGVYNISIISNERILNKRVVITR